MSHKEDLRVREARKAARIVAAERGITYQQALDRIAQDAGAAHWTGFMADPTLHISLAAYQSSALAFDGAPADVDPIIPFQRMARGADRVAQSVRHLLDAAERLVTEGEGLASQGQSPSAALGHADLLIEQVRQLAEPLDDLAKDVLSLYDGHPRRKDQVINARTPRQHYRDIQERVGLIERRIRAARANMPESLSAENAADYYHRMRFGRTFHGHPDVFRLAQEESSPDSLGASFILAQYATLLRNLPSRMDREHGQLLAQWARWTGYAVHNLPEIASGAYDSLPREDGRLVHECRCFVKDAQTNPIPVYWHPDHPEFNRWMNGGELWVRLCDFVARRAGLPPAYGVPVDTTDVSDDMQPFPEPPQPVLGLHKASSVTDYARRVRNWAEWLSRGRRIVVRRWEPATPSSNVAADEPHGERA